MKTKTFLTPDQVSSSLQCYHNLFDAFLILDDALTNLQECCSHTPFTQSLEKKLLSARNKVKNLDKLYLIWIRDYTSGNL